MMNLEDMRLQKMLDALVSLGLSEEEESIVEAYLCGEKDETALAKIDSRNLGEVASKELEGCYKVLDSLVNKKRDEELRKMMQALFAIGCSTVCFVLFNHARKLNEAEFRRKCGLDDAKCAAIYACHVGNNHHMYYKSTIENLFQTAGQNPDNLIKAEDYYNCDNANGRFFLYAAYFLKKYPEGMPKSIFSNKKDKELLKTYEDLIVRNVDKVFEDGPNCSFMTEQWRKALKKEVASGKISGNTKRQIKGLELNKELLHLLGGCAYINYRLSPVMRAVIVLFAGAEQEKTLEMIKLMDCLGRLKTCGGDFDEIFEMDAKGLIRWVATNESYSGFHAILPEIAEVILARQFRKNRQLYLDYYNEADFSAANHLLKVIEKENPALHKKLLGGGQSQQKEMVIKEIVNRMPYKPEVSAYLRGETSVEDLYQIENRLTASPIYGGYHEKDALERYMDRYHEQDLYNRTLVLMSICQMGTFFRQLMGNVEKDTAKVFQGFEQGELNIEHQVQGLITITDGFYSDNDKNKILNAAIPVFERYLKEKSEETEKAFANAPAYGRYFGLCVMDTDKDRYKEQIFAYTKDTSKLVKEKLAEILKSKPEWQKDVEMLLSSKKKAERELAAMVLNTAAAEDKKEDTKQERTPAKLIETVHKGGKKRSLAWAYEVPFSAVHMKNGEEASEEYMQAILLCYTSMTAPGLNENAQMLTKELNETELAVYVNELFDRWLVAGAEAKKRWVMYVASIYGGSDIVKKLHHQIQEWSQNSRGAIAADAVRALAINPQPQALLIVDSIARKFKFKQVKTAAGEALEFAAQQLGLTREQLEDKIVPNLGFDEHMERHFDYGARTFTVTITPALEIEIFGEDGKKLKNLPAPGKKDEEEKANAAYAAFKDMKKQMKTTVSSQKMRLEQALSSERLWSIEAWQNLFVKNPVMHQFAIGLIWGIYEEHKLVQSFRYMEDGSFNTEDEDEYTLPEIGNIGLVHPIELSNESKEAWKQQLEDYEITQPIEQLSRPIFYRSDEEEKEKTLDRFGGMYVNDLSLNGKLLQLGWYRGSVQDAGCFDTFYREDASIGLGVELHFSGTYVACEGEDVTVYEARFYKAGTVARGSYMYDEAEGDKMVALNEVPERYFSEIVFQLTKATASSSEKDENWKKDRN